MNEKTKERFYQQLQQIDSYWQPSWSMDRCGIQDSFCFRALKEARLIAQQLVNEKGHLMPASVTLHVPIYSEGYSDDAFHSHQQKFLKRWQSDPLFIQKFRRFSLPLFHPFAEKVIRWTLDLAPEETLKDFHIKRAALTACLTPLRQSLGSCFATAPAIEIQQFHLDLLIDDLYELLSRGKLRRVVEGIEYAAPFCLSTGFGDLKKVIRSDLPYFASPGLIRAWEVSGKVAASSSFIEKVHASEKICQKHFRPGMRIKDLIVTVAGEEACDSFKGVVDNALLKIWEFTLASYCDIKAEFSKWNLGWCVGLSPQEISGIGATLRQALEEKLRENHQEVEKKYQEATVTLEQLRAVEALSYHANSQDELRRLKAEGIAKAHHLKVCQDLYQEAQQKEKLTAEILPRLIQYYTQKFQDYFQEVYDPEFSDEDADVYEDRQAGFRLVYKHGRAESTLWTSIRDRNQFITALDNFFRSTESFVIDLCHEPYEKMLVAEMTTLILHHLQTEEFYNSTFARARKQGRLPWAYSAGGTVEQIASLYFRRSSPLKSEQRQVHDELDLLTFMIETMKGFPPTVTNSFIKDPQRSLLFQSPTHVCLLLPGTSPFKEAWHDSGLTYTWIRDRWLNPAKQFYLEQVLSRDQQQELYRRIGWEGETKEMMTLEEFATHLKHISIDELGSFLFHTLPLIPAAQCQALLHPFSANLKLPPFLSSEELFQFMLHVSGKSSASAVREKMRHLRLAPSVFLFADTNWPNGYFSFVVHPVTLQLEVWKTDQAGVRGSPIQLVKSWLSKKDVWSIFWN